MLESLENVAYIPLSQGERAIVDVEDYALLSEFNWYCQKSYGLCYAVRRVTKRGRPGVELMHRRILGLTDRRMLTDHINGNGLDNRKVNLRSAIHAENMRNRHKRVDASSKYLGVNWDNGRNRWIVRIRVNGKRIHLGRFTHEIDAALAYDAAARYYHREFANPNFSIEESQTIKSNVLGISA